MKKNLNVKFSMLAILAIMFVSSCETNEVTGVSLNSTEISLNLGGVDTLLAETEYSGNIIPTVAWKSSDASIVKVTNGAIEALKKGTVTITATAGEKTATCKVIVTDQISPSTTQGEFWYYGDPYQTEKSNNMVVYLASAGINMTDFSGTGEIIYIELNTALTATDSIPQGTYTMAADLDVELFNPFTMVPGYVDAESEWGTWYFGKTANDITEGTAIVTKKGNTYTISYEFADYYGNTISGTYTGALTYYNYFDYVEEASAKISNMKKSKLNLSRAIKR